jgi:hypothetical protein
MTVLCKGIQYLSAVLVKYLALQCNGCDAVVQVLVLLRLYAARCSCVAHAFQLLPLMTVHPYWGSLLLCDAIRKCSGKKLTRAPLLPAALVTTFTNALHSHPHLPGLYWLLHRYVQLQDAAAHGE